MIKDHGRSSLKLLDTRIMSLRLVRGCQKRTYYTPPCLAEKRELKKNEVYLYMFDWALPADHSAWLTFQKGTAGWVMPVACLCPKSPMNEYLCPTVSWTMRTMDYGLYVSA
jgi:hypothetical protein